MGTVAVYGSVQQVTALCRNKLTQSLHRLSLSVYNVPQIKAMLAEVFQRDGESYTTFKFVSLLIFYKQLLIHKDFVNCLNVVDDSKFLVCCMSTQNYSNPLI
jgi:hypothetical protein